MSNINDMSSKFGKLEKFDGVDFRCWQRKMHFLLKTLKVVYVLSTPRPDERDDEMLEEARKRNKWENDDNIYRGHVLNEEDASSKKFLVVNFMNYKMSDSRPYYRKLPPLWNDFKHMLKHKKEELSLIQLGGHLRIEESLRDQEGNKPKNKETKGSSSINMMEEGESSIRNKGKKCPFENTKNGPNKRPKGACSICGKSGHFKRDCQVGRGKKGTNANRSWQGSKDQTSPTHQGQILDCGLNSVKNDVPLISKAFYV
ncbi:hypothetical protein RND81_10G017300 [Saponaria officinalis]|uniref:CCHC-type domain-containing protein n=1 Tax=Saponaria officinalis TaxID=3572 RepID=A0AAW1HY67_SAPOF